MIYIYVFVVGTIIFVAATFFSVASFAIFIIWYTTHVLAVARALWD